MISNATNPHALKTNSEFLAEAITHLDGRFGTYTTPTTAVFHHNYNTGEIAILPGNSCDVEVRGVTFSGSKFCEVFHGVDAIKDAANYVNRRFMPGFQSVAPVKGLTQKKGFLKKRR